MLRLSGNWIDTAPGTAFQGIVFSLLLLGQLLIRNILFHGVLLSVFRRLCCPPLEGSNMIPHFLCFVCSFVKIYAQIQKSYAHHFLKTQSINQESSSVDDLNSGFVPSSVEFQYTYLHEDQPPFRCFCRECFVAVITSSRMALSTSLQSESSF